MKREKLLLFLFVLIPSLIGIVLAGRQKVHGQPPTCPAPCACREVDWWFYKGGTLSYSERRKGTATWVKQGLKDIGTTETCQGVPRHTPTTEDYWQHSYCIVKCWGGIDPPGDFPLSEAVCTDLGTRVDTDTWWWCKK
ncbi:MAG: hypothetical protein K2W96_25435 [Gemmataceae bacterium]|nr:hypothetical protein [Gemmataceae bacterium]